VDPHAQFCPNSACPARGQVGRGNITIHSQREQRYRCAVCGRTFSARTGTPCYRQHYAPALITLVVPLVAHGCPHAAVVAAFGLHPRTVARWVATAGTHCQAVHAHLVEHPRDLGQVQADELRVKTQAGIVWIAMAVQVVTRLWLGGVVSAHRDRALLATLAAQIAWCATCAPLLLVVDGLRTYVSVFLAAFRQRVPRRRGRLRRVVWPDVVIGQVVKQYAGAGWGRRWRVTGVVRRVAYGTPTAARQLVPATQGAGVLNTACIERLNAIFRAQVAPLGRRSRHLARRPATLTAGLYLVGTVYNFCTVHTSLPRVDQWGRRQTPAMAAGLTDHCWSVGEVLEYQVPPPRWQPLKQRGRRAKALQELIDRWAA
jgi:transposase-like protein